MNRPAAVPMILAGALAAVLAVTPALAARSQCRTDVAILAYDSFYTTLRVRPTPVHDCETPRIVQLKAKHTRQLNDLQDYWAAQGTARKRLKLTAEACGADHPATREAAIALGMTLYSAEDYEKAIPYLSRIDNTADPAGAQGIEIVASSLHALADSHFQTGDPARAEAVARRALIGYEDEDAAHEALTRQLLGDILFVQKRYNEAESQYQQSIALLEQDQSLTPSVKRHSWTGLLCVYTEQQRADDAADALAEIRDIDRNLAIALDRKREAAKYHIQYLK